jgi:multiple sugar transport system permease protein
VRPRSRAEDVAGLGTGRAVLFVLPALLIIGMFLLFPALWTVWLGMTNFRLTGLAAANTEFVGLDNYRHALTDPSFWNSLRLTVVFVALSGVIGQTVCGFTLAWSLRRVTGWARTLLETLVLAAWVIPGSVIAFLWIALLDRRGSSTTR